MKKIATITTVIVLMMAAIVEWRIDQRDVNHILAERYIGKCEPITFPGAKAFQSSDKTAVIFTQEGFQGTIEGLFVLSNNEIEQLVILKSFEGLDNTVLSNAKFLQSFERNVMDLPLDIDAISGATISSQIVIDEMNRCLKEWNKKND